MLKIFIIAGEASGDLHGANLVKSLLTIDPSLEIKAYGGRKMREAGADVVRDFQDYAFMGFFEVVKHLRPVLNNLKETRQIIEDFRPDHLIFIDFPSFNLRVAKHLKRKLKSTQFSFYISPKVWAWKSGRVHQINRLMDQIYVIFPFEVDFYAKYGYQVEYIGNPLLDEIDSRKTIAKDLSLTAVLPGSRLQEIQKMLPIFAQLSVEMPERRFEVSTMDYIPRSIYKELTKETGKNFFLSTRSTYDLLQEAGNALVTSGTATLETALFKTPQIVAYKTSQVSFWIAKMVVKIKYISLVNIILNREAIRELIQDELTVTNLKNEVRKMSKNSSAILSSYEELRQLLGKGGASMKLAQSILKAGK